MNAIAGNAKDDNSVYCFAKPGQVYLVYLPKGGTAQLDLSSANGPMKVQWFDPRNGGALRSGSVKSVRAGASVELGEPPSDPKEDWLVMISR